MKNIATKYFLTFFYLCLIINTSFAQLYNFKNFSPKNGLAGSVINSIFQDSKGFIWFGTQGSGISRFDGKAFKNFTKNDGLAPGDITCINEDKQGNIWIGTSEGISKFDGIKFQNFIVKNGHSDNSIYSIYVDKKNDIWFATAGGGVAIFNGKKLKRITTADGLSSNQVYAITQDGKGNFWFALGNGISKYDGTKIINYNNVNVDGDNTFFSLLCDSKGSLWFGSVSGVIIKYNGTDFTEIKIPEEVNKDFIGSIAEDKLGNIWFATSHGALKYDGESFRLFSEKQGLASNLVLSLCRDYEGNMWIGSQGGGADLFNNESFVNYTDKSGLSSNKIGAIYKDNTGNLIVGTQGTGLNIFEKDKFVQINSIPELAQSNILSIAQNSKGIWVGVEGAGVYVLKKTGSSFSIVEHITKIDTNEINAVIKIITEKNGDVWLATYGSGLILLKTDNTFEIFNSKNGFPSDNILTLFQDSNGILWAGTFDSGVVKYDGKKITNYTEKDGLSNKSVWSITEDDNHNMFFGTTDGGISCFNGKSFKTISTIDGLCSSYIPVLLWDKIEKCLWAGTNKGINKIKFKKNFEIASLRYYGEQEGFKGVEVLANSKLLDKEGLIWFGTTNGLCRYNRNFDFPNTTAPKLRLNNIRLFYQTVDWKKFSDSVDLRNNLPYNLVLSHKNNHLTFDFQALTINNVKYTYLLEGQDNDWSPLSTNTEASFTNIAPGKSYTFKVKAINSYGVWSNDVVTFTFTISPPWWQTWWFYTFMTVIIIAAFFAYNNYKTAHHVKEKKKLEEKVTERTVELKGANDKLSLAFQDIKDSINYAKKIQNAILPLDVEIKRALPQSFVLFKPRDVVSGDFYWFNKKEEQVYIAAVDCTGHGVPGAFMSMIGNSLLNEIVSKKGSHDAADVLKKLHQGVRKSLKQDRDSYESKDGMDLALAVYDISKNTLQYSGAKRSLYRFRKNEDGVSFEETKADKQSIGGLQLEEEFNFTNHNFELQKGDTFYLFTDGYVDQFGGEKGKKFSSKRLKDTLGELQPYSLLQQSEKLNDIIDQWKTGVEQIDDILVIGFRF